MEALLQTLMDKVDHLIQQIGRVHSSLEGRRKTHFTVQEVANLTGRSPYTVRTHWIGKGLLPAEKLNGGKLLIKAEELERFIASTGKVTVQSITTVTTTMNTLRFDGPYKPVKPYDTRRANIRAMEEALQERDW